MAHYHVLIFGGQSNMRGYGSVLALPETSLDAPFREYAAPTGANMPGLFNAQNGGALQDRWHGSHLYAEESDYGPDYSFLQLYVEAYPTRNVCALKSAFGGSSIDNWISDAPGEGWGFDALTTQVEQAEARLAAAGHTWEYDALCWLQGETPAFDVSKTLSDPASVDAPDLGLGYAFVPKTLALFAAVRTLTGTPNLPVCQGRLGDFLKHDTLINAQVASDPRFTAAQYRACIDRRWEQQAAVAAADPRCATFSNDGFTERTGDEFHPTDPGLVTSGERMFAAYQGLVARRTNATRLRAGGGRVKLRAGGA